MPVRRVTKPLLAYSVLPERFVRDCQMLTVRNIGESAVNNMPRRYNWGNRSGCHSERSEESRELLERRFAPLSVTHRAERIPIGFEEKDKDAMVNQNNTGKVFAQPCPLSVCVCNCGILLVIGSSSPVVGGDIPRTFLRRGILNPRSKTLAQVSPLRDLRECLAL